MSIELTTTITNDGYNALSKNVDSRTGIAVEIDRIEVWAGSVKKGIFPVTGVAMANGRQIRVRATITSERESYNYDKIKLLDKKSRKVFAEVVRKDRGVMDYVSPHKKSVLTYNLAFTTIPENRLTIAVGSDDGQLMLAELDKHKDDGNAHPDIQAKITPKSLTHLTVNKVFSDGHTHTLPKASTAVMGIVKTNNSLTSSATDEALAAAQGKVIKTLLDTKIGNSGDQTITNGTLTVGNPALWPKIHFPTSDGGRWRLEFNPAGDTDKRLNFVFTNSGNTATYLKFPTINKTENVAYQSWVADQANTKLDNSGDVILNGSLRSQTVNYFDSRRLGYTHSGFYRTNGVELDGKRLPSLEIHITHPNYGNNGYARGIGFAYGSSFDLYTTSWNADGQYQGYKRILIEDDIASTTQAGIVQLTSSTNDSSETKAATAKAVKAAYDKAVAAYSKAEAATRVVRSSKSKTVTSTNTARANQVKVSGEVVIYPDGRIVQTFLLENTRLIDWKVEDDSRGRYRDSGDTGRQIEIDLWTAMPNKVFDVRVQTLRTVAADSITYWAEGGEWLAAWNKQAQGSSKSRVSTVYNRIEGSGDEPIDIYIIVEGY